MKETKEQRKRNLELNEIAKPFMKNTNPFAKPFMNDLDKTLL